MSHFYIMNKRAKNYTVQWVILGGGAASIKKLLLQYLKEEILAVCNFLLFAILLWAGLCHILGIIFGEGI